MPIFAGVCRSQAKLTGKTAIITGCNSGIGKETVMDFYLRGAKVIMACRNIEKAEEAKKDVEESCKYIAEKGEIEVAKCDLSSLTSVKEFAESILESEPQVNILVNNAGVMMCPYTLTEDGYEMQFATNHLGGTIHFDDLNFKVRRYWTLDAYGQSKLANVMFSRELATRLKKHEIKGVNTYSLHPGVIRTDLGRHLDTSLFPGAKMAICVFGLPCLKNPRQGAQTTIYCAVDEKCANETGLYYSDCVTEVAAAPALDNAACKKLWDMSVELVGLKDFDPFKVETPTDEDTDQQSEEYTSN